MIISLNHGKYMVREQIMHEVGKWDENTGQQ